jgi:hypothetical protein
MKFPKKLRLMGLGFAVCGLLASVSALAKAPAAAKGGVVLPKGAQDLSDYMVVAGGLDNVPYMSCLKTRLKGPPEKNVVYNVEAAISCKSLRN